MSMIPIPHGPVRSVLALVLGLAFGVGFYVVFFQGQGTLELSADQLSDMVLTSVGGEVQSLQEITRDTPAVIAVFASWCQYCKPVMRHLKQFNTYGHGNGVAVYAVNYGEDAAAVRQVVEDLQLEMPVLMDQHLTFARSLGIDGIPVVLGVARGGEIRYTAYALPPKEEWADFVASLK